MNIFNQIKQEKYFSNNEQVIADYILKSPEDFIQMSSQQISKSCAVSPATIYRLCTKLNLSGLSELKVKISAGLTNYYQENNDFDFNYPVKQYQTHHEIMMNLQEDYQQTITSTINLVDLNNLQKIVFAMQKAHKIKVYTSAGNIYFAENFKFQLAEIGCDIDVPIEEYCQKLAAVNSSANDLAIVISFGGRGTFYRTIMEILSTKKTPILLISSPQDMAMKSLAKYHLTMPMTENHYQKISSYSTRLSLLYLLDLIYTCYFNLDYQKNLDTKLTYYQQMNRKKL